MDDALVIEGRQLGFVYAASKWSLRDVEIRLAAGQILALTGANGSGKTTLMKLLATVLRPGSGTLRILGDNAVRHRNRVRHRIGYVAQKSALADSLSVRDNLYLVASFHGLSPRGARRRTSELVEVFSMGGFGARTVGELSGGQYRRVALARAFVGDPRLLLLDEPTVGMDAASRDGFHALLSELAGGVGVAVVIASHDPVEVGRLAHHRLHLDGGMAEAVERVAPERDRPLRTVVARFLRDLEGSAVDHFCRRFPHVRQVEPGALEFRIPEEDPLNELLGQLAEAGAVVDVRVVSDSGVASDREPGVLV